MNNEFKLPEEPNVKGYTITIDERLYQRLEKHLRILRHIEHKGLSKQKWVMDAIKEKLEKEDCDKNSALPKDRHLVLMLNELINVKIASKVNVQKQFRNSYSKKQWLLEAIYEKLENEEHKTKQFLDELNAK